MSDHGTERGYQKHLKNDEQACGHCLWAHRVYNKAEKTRRIERERKPIPTKVEHGTPAGIAFHLNSGIAVCRYCLDAACDLEQQHAHAYLTRLYRKDGNDAA